MFNCKLRLSLRAGYSIGDVYEVASWSSANGHTFDQAMEGWKTSQGHNVVIRGINEWAKNTKNGGCWASGKFVNCYFSAGVETPKTSSESVIATFFELLIALSKAFLGPPSSHRYPSKKVQYEQLYTDNLQWHSCEILPYR